MIRPVFRPQAQPGLGGEASQNAASRFLTDPRRRAPRRTLMKKSRKSGVLVWDKGAQGRDSAG